MAKKCAKTCDERAELLLCFDVLVAVAVLTGVMSLGQFACPTPHPPPDYFSFATGLDWLQTSQLRSGTGFSNNIEQSFPFFFASRTRTWTQLPRLQETELNLNSSAATLATVLTHLHTAKQHLIRAIPSRKQCTLPSSVQRFHLMQKGQRPVFT